MSKQNNYHIRCPKCAQEQDVKLYDAINIQVSPELKEQLMANRLNMVTCEHCAFVFRVDMPLLYNDPAHRLVIYLLPASDASIERGQEQFSEWLKALNAALPEGVEGPEMHLVFSRAELVERIFLLEAGLNERIIEYIKYLIFSQNLDRLDPGSTRLLFNAEDSTEQALCFVIQNMNTQKLEGMLEYSQEAYRGLCEMFDRDDQTPSLMEMFPGPYISARALFLADSAA